MQVQHIFLNIKPTCCKEVLHDRYRQIGFHFISLSSDLQSSFLEVLLTRFLVPKRRLIQSHMSPFWDFYYIIHSYPSESIKLMVEPGKLHSLLAG